MHFNINYIVSVPPFCICFHIQSLHNFVTNNICKEIIKKSINARVVVLILYTSSNVDEYNNIYIYIILINNR